MKLTGIGYVRVSTVKQGESGLGLEAQLAAIDLYAHANSVEVMHIYREVESGRNSDRPELAKALKHAKRIGARLIIAKLDRLARNVHFVSGLMESGVDFVATDNPHANKLTIHILAAVAENEAEMISHRTKVALAAAKARGTLLGSARPGHWDGLENRRLEGALKGGRKSARKRAAEAAEAYSDILPTIQQLKGEGYSLRDIADKLNSDEQTNAKGRPWNHMQVKYVLSR
jgi:DNA invertase Pin-like site-specific DNA recombinase